ncbi:zinc finger protein 7 [Pseudorasbora parva]|uniref:zinc finger protein 7 n=1 Tax=Pseudorasbora parva TaxID=51549 RepID=UPI00351F107A
MVFLHSDVCVESESEMSSGTLQTQLTAIMSVLAKAAVAEIARLMEDSAAALHQHIRGRDEEIRALKTRLRLAENRPQTDTCSIGVQADSPDTSVAASADHLIQEKIVVKNVSEENSQFSHTSDVKREESALKEPEEEELSGLEFQMKIEQVEELVDQTLNQAQREAQNHRPDGSSGLWCKALEHPGTLMESHSQDFTDPYVMMMMEDPMIAPTQSGLLENESFGATDVEFDLNLQDSHRPLQSSSIFPKTLPQGPHAGKHPEKRFRCQLCGKAFAQRTRLLTHRLVHTGEKPFRCEECGKGFTQRTRLITHRLVHTGEKPFRCQLCGKTFSRQDNCLRHVRLHSGQRS